MKKTSLILSAILATALFCCKKENAAIKQPGNFEKINQVKWLIGNWENNSPEGLLLESWEKKNDSTFMGTSFFIHEKDTLFAEQIELQQRSGELLYVPTVTNQNDGKAVSFKVTSLSKMHFTAENPAHDFPQKLTYDLKGKDSLVAEISGLEKGKPKSETFRMKRK